MPKTTQHPAYTKFMASLRARRRELDLTQAELGKRVGKTQSWVAKLEACEQRMDLVEFYEIAKGLELDAVSSAATFFEGMESVAPRRRRAQVRA